MLEFDATIYTGDPAYNYSGEEGQDGHMETFSPFIEIVNELAKTSPRKIWTVIDGDDGNMYISAGYHFVNRAFYFISNEPWKHEHEEYLWFESDEFIVFRDKLHELCLCEHDKIIPKPGEFYRFTVDQNCQACLSLEQAYLTEED